MIRPEIRGLEAYNPGPVPDGCIRIVANENNLGVSPKAREGMMRAMLEGNRYPDGTCTELRKKLAAAHGLRPEQILVGNGLDGVFTILARTFLSSGDEVVCGELTFSVYADNAEIMGAKAVTVPMTEKMELDVEGFIRAVTDKTKMVCFCNPNNPTGTLASLRDVRLMIEATPKNALFALDEAYIEFSSCEGRAGLALLDEYPNLIVCRTFSKIYGLAGLRVGWIAAHPELLGYMYRVREPYAVSRISAAGAEAALDDKEFYEKSRAVTIAEREKLCRFLSENNIPYVPSQGNFVLLTSGGAAPLCEALAAKGIVARLLSFRGAKALRITVGTPEENILLTSALLEATA